MHLLPGLLQKYKLIHPDIEIQLVDYDLNNIQECINNRANDIIFIPDHFVDSSSTKNFINIYSEPMCLVSSNNPNYDSENTTISIYDIPDTSLILPSKKALPSDYKLINDMLKISNKTYEKVHEANSLNSLILMVKSGMGIAFLASHMELYYKDLMFTKLKEFQNYFRISCVWRDDSNVFVNDFVNFINNAYPKVQ